MSVKLLTIELKFINKFINNFLKSGIVLMLLTKKEKFSTGITMEIQGTALRQEREVRTHGAE